MAVSIRREKGGLVHYAVSLDAKLSSDGSGVQVVTGTGQVTEWSPDAGKAGRFPDALGQHAARHDNGRANAGTVTFTDERGRVLAAVDGAAAPEPDETELQELRAERDEFRRQARVLSEEVERLRAEAAQQKTYADTAAQVDEGRRKEIADLTRKVAELEKQLAAKPAEKPGK
ncbi:Chromosome partition protein Smc [Gemmata obscuriglobus]|uniref:Uncharacterized protein n=1 Tax=Gemmata obscuriglobus TaxID=114 RepID=A0A2Z3GV02_9BACT|nr:hypothetical protein [Gemmata obscuriglobus]AWM35892.1 hypothetical protein C1280_01950 [Gemmata obscuriglobus]QEG31555.1 Chromosome partition protein Smc [Gemmata obscuriglobus]VTS10897.1 unnamed protein product [Gemmata obscuriglobus UQM 2246]